MRNQVFVSYSHHDKKLMEELLVQMKPFLGSGAVGASWSDEQIAPGGDWLSEIQTALSKTSVAVLLVSPEYLASDFIKEHELGPLLNEAEAGRVKILWVMLRASAYKETLLRRYQAVEPPEKPLPESKTDRAKVWLRICEEIKNAVGSSTGLAAPDGSPSRPADANSAAAAASPRSGTQRGESDVSLEVAVNSFSIHFQVARRQIGLLTSYKDLHDFVHQVPARFFAPIATEAKRFPEDESARTNLSRHSDDLQGAVDSLDNLVRGGTFDGDEPKQVRLELTAAQTDLEAALATASAEELSQALWHLKRIPRLLTPINLRLNNAAKAVNLQALVATLETVCSKVRTLGLRSEQVEVYEDRAKVLARLNLSLNPLVADHNRWQSVEEELRRIEGDLDRSLDELESSWPGLKSQIEPLCGSRADDWALKLASYGEQLDTTLKTHDPVKVRDLFGRYRDRAGRRFFNVDVDLKRECHDLRDVGMQLDMVGRFLG